MLNSNTKEQTQLQAGDRVYFIVSADQGTEVVFYRPQEGPTDLLLSGDDGQETLWVRTQLSREGCRDVATLFGNVAGSLSHRDLAPSSMPGGDLVHRFQFIKS